MNAPNADLMEFYGTDIHYLEKSGAISPGMLTALRVAAPLGSMAWMQSDSARRQKILMEAEAMNQAFRWVEKQRMSAMQAGFSGGGPRGFGKFGSVKTAGKVGLMLQRATNVVSGKGLERAVQKASRGYGIDDQLVREVARIGKTQGLARGALGAAAIGTVGAAAHHLGKKKGKKDVEKESTASALSPALHKYASDIGRRLACGTAGPELVTLMEKAASGAALTEMEKEALIGKLLGSLSKGFGKALGSAGKALGGTGGLKVGRGGLAQKGGDWLRKKGIGARTSGLVSKGVKAAPKKAGGGLLSFGTKAKLVGAGALALGGYGAYKGMQATRDYMMRPTAMGRQGSYGAAPTHNVGAYGYNISQL